jgi:hypothetical protein
MSSVVRAHLLSALRARRGLITPVHGVAWYRYRVGTYTLPAANQTS